MNLSERIRGSRAATSLESEDLSKNYQALAEALELAGEYGYSAQWLEENKSDAKRLAEKVLENGGKRSRLGDTHIKIIKAFTGLYISQEQKKEAAFDDFTNPKNW